MKFYVEIFNKDDELMDGYIKTDVTPEQVIEVTGGHPVSYFELSKELADRLEIKDLDFDTKDYFLTAAREFPDEAYEYLGEKLYPPPMFLPDCFNSEPIRGC